MANAALALARREHADRLSAMRRNVKTQALKQGAIRHGTGLMTGAAYGVLAMKGVRNDIGGFPWKLGVYGVALIGEAALKGSASAACSGVGIATNAVYTYNAIRSKTLIAGEGGNI